MHPLVDTTDGIHQVLMILASSLGLVLYLKVMWNRQSVALLEICLTVAYIFVTFPNGTFSSYVIKRGVNTPTCIFHLILACLISQAVAFQLTRKSREPEVLFCTTVSNILTRAGLSLCALHGIVSVKAISNFSCMLTLAVLFPLIAGDIVHLLHMKLRYGATVGDPISWYISVDSMATFLLGGCAMAFPTLLYGKQDEAVNLIVKALGCVVVGQSLLSFGSLCFSKKEDALAILKAKLVMHLICLFSTAASFYTDPDFWTHGHPIFVAFIAGALSYNAGKGVVGNELLA